MKIAILSGKGGTGKTFVGTNLAAILPAAVYVDCDVEEPNGHLFLHPTELVETKVQVPVPVVNNDVCTACRTCVDFCRYNALALIGEKVKVFSDICHSCGGCALFCPEKAIQETGRTIGTVSRGVYSPVGSHNAEFFVTKGQSKNSLASSPAGPSSPWAYDAVTGASSGSSSTSSLQGSSHLGGSGLGGAPVESSEASPRLATSTVESPVAENTLEQSLFYSGRLHPGEASGVPLIEAVLRMVDEQVPKAEKNLKNEQSSGREDTAKGKGYENFPCVDTDNGPANKGQTVIIDCPPGSACVVMESIKDADFCLLVAEPTVFGAHNLEMVHELVRIFNKPHGVVLNKDVPDQENPSAEFCLANDVTVLGSVPYSQEVARITATGGLAVRELASIREIFCSLAEKISEQGGRS